MPHTPMKQKYIDVFGDHCHVLALSIIGNLEEEIMKFKAKASPGANKEGDIPASSSDVCVITGSEWIHANGNKYRVICIANKDTERSDRYPASVVYQGEDMKIWSRPLTDWHRSMTPSQETIFSGMLKQHKPTRKIIQISEGPDSTAALCDDGTAWIITRNTWHRLLDIPQD